MSSFLIGDHDFLLDGAPFRILSGALHYFRVHPDLWADRIRKARQMGLNTIETYVAWNAHAPQEGEFNLDGNLDLGRFLDLVADEGMHAILRPGPYICAEWDNGGLPAWLFAGDEVGIRRDEARYMQAVTTYFEQLAPVIVPRQISAGGPIILVQIENEYGAYGHDEAYLRKLVELNRRIGLTVPFTTVDQPIDEMLRNGSLPGLHKTGSFGSRIAERLATLKHHQPTGPLMCSEFWVGWFDNWGAHHHTTSIEQSAADLDLLLSKGASVNIYMFHGGTNFGFTNGANDKGVYQPIVTSYDYDAPLDEAGNPTAKYWAFRDVLAKYTTVDDSKPKSAVPGPIFTAPITKSISLWDVADSSDAWSRHDNPPSFDGVGHYAGLMIYRTQIDTPGSTDGAVLEISDLRDRAQIFLNRNSVGVISRDHHESTLGLPDKSCGTLEILVEDQGRVDYGPRLGEQKGIIGTVTVNAANLQGWNVLPLPLTDVTPISDLLDLTSDRHIVSLRGPIFGQACFDLPEAGDLYLDTQGWGKGVVWVNGFCIGRYWGRGPQNTLYVPGPVLRLTENKVTVLELTSVANPKLSFVAAHDLGHVDF